MRHRNLFPWIVALAIPAMSALAATDPGAATIVRPSRTFELDIAGTRADLSTTGLVMTVRHCFGRAR